MASGQLSAGQIAYAEYLQSPRWRLLRAIRRRLDGNRCRVCFASERLEVHHRSYRNRGRGFIGELRDTITLCRRCHSTHHEAVRRD